MEVPFYKYHGSGNDFIIIDNYNNNYNLESVNIKSLCDRNLGIGSDGLIIIVKSNFNDFEMIYYNSDGNLGSFCGNGARCVISYAYNKFFFNKKCKFTSCDGDHIGIVNDDSISLKMKDVYQINKTKLGWEINTGSPHLVIFKDEIDNLNISKLSNSIFDLEYPKKNININFVKIENNRVKIRTFERGVFSETLSCGTGSVAAALISFYLGYIKNKRIEIFSIGGNLNVQFENNNSNFSNIYLEGKTKFVFKGDFNV